MNEKYDIIAEIKYQQNWYYITKEFEILKKKSGVNLPYSPINNFKKYCKKSYFEVIKREEVSGELEDKILKELERLKE